MRRCWIGMVVLMMVATAAWGQDVKPADRKAFLRAMEQYDGRHYREAAKQMRQVAARNPQSADAQYWLGMMAVKDGFNTAGIRRYFGRCITLAPSYPKPLAHYYMALIHYTDDRFEEAIAELEIYFQQVEQADDAEASALYEEASNYLHWSRFLAEAAINAAPFSPQRVGGVSSSMNEMLPFFAWDGSTAYYLRQVPERRAPTFYNREMEQRVWQLYFSRKMDSTFSKGVPLPSPFNSGLPEGGVSLTADGRELYFSIIREQNGYQNSDIYMVRRVEGEWQQPEALGPQVNSPTSWESQPTVSPDGNQLIFASNRKGGVGGIDLWRCHRLPNGDWSRATNLGTSINTTGNEKQPFLAADGHTLYFLSDGWQGFGGYDIYFSDLDDEYGNRPINLGLPINTEADEGGIGVMADGEWAYFAGRMEGARSSDIMTFSLYPAARPDPMVLVRTAVADSQMHPLSATVEVSRGFYHASNGEAVYLLPRTGGCEVAFVADSCLPIVVSVSAHDISQRRLPRKVLLPRATAGQSMPLSLTGNLSQRLDIWVKWLTEHPRVRLIIECPKAEDAQRVVAYLVGKGLRSERFATRSGTAVATPKIVVQ